MADVVGTSGTVHARLETLPPSEWTAIVSTFDDACIEQTFEYAAARAGARRLRHLVVRRSDRIVAAAQVVLAEIPLLRTGVAYVKFGPLWRVTGREPDIDDLSTACVALRDTLARDRHLMVRLMPPASPEHGERIARTMREAGFVRTGQDPGLRFLVDLSVDAETRRAGLKPKWRYNLKRAERHGMRVVRSDDRADIDRFAALYGEVRARKGFSEGPAPTELRKILAGMPPETRPVLVLCNHGERLVAAAVVATLGDTAVYLFGASAGDALPLGAGYLLHWEIGRWLETSSCRWYDLGGDCGLSGLRQFKSGLVGKTGRSPTLPGCFDTSMSLRGRLLGAGVFAVRDSVTRLRRRPSDRRR